MPEEPSFSSSRRTILTGTAFGLAVAALSGTPTSTAVPTKKSAADSAMAWTAATYELVRREGLSPPAAARIYALVGITMFEATRGGAQSNKSLARKLRGLKEVPAAKSPGKLDWPCVLSFAAHRVLERTLTFAGPSSRPLLERTLNEQLAERSGDGISAAKIKASREPGVAIGNHIADWAATDGFAALASRSYEAPLGEARLWEPTPPAFRGAIEPYWGTIRPMILDSADEIRPLTPVAFNPNPASEFGEEALATYRQSLSNTAEQRTIARFWADNAGAVTGPLSNATGLPSGHWMLLATIGIDRRNSDLAEACWIYAVTGIALHEAFLNCWTWKYRFNLLRPVTYIRRYIDSDWLSFLTTPAFPEYTSGHSVGSAAAATVLTELLGKFEFTDDTGADRGLAPRSFDSFAEAAKEASKSRLFGGIHYPMGIANGFKQGEDVGERVLNWLD